MDLLKKFLVEAHWNNDEFVRVWNNASSVQEVADFFGTSKNVVSFRASMLRKPPYNEKLKSFRSSREVPKHSLSRQEIISKIPPKEQFVEIWNDDPTYAAVSLKLGIPAHVVKDLVTFLMNEKDNSGMQMWELREPIGRGNRQKYHVDPTTFLGLYKQSTRYSDLVERIADYLGLDKTHYPNILNAARIMVFKINKFRRAKGLPDLPKLERPTYKKNVTGAWLDKNLAAAHDIEVQDVADEDVADVDFSKLDVSDDSSSSDESSDEEKTDPDIFVGSRSEDVEEPEEFESDDEDDPKDPNEEFAEIWNSSGTFIEAVRALRADGWDLSMKEIKDKASYLKSKGKRLKNFKEI